MATQESKSAKIMEGFKNLVPQYALVRRNGGEKLTVSSTFTKSQWQRQRQTNTKAGKIIFLGQNTIVYLFKNVDKKQATLVQTSV